MAGGPGVKPGFAASDATVLFDYTTHPLELAPGTIPRRLYESRVLPTELASRVFPRNLAGRAGFEPAHGVINSHMPFQLGYRPKSRRPRFLVGAFEKCLNLDTENGQTNPEGPARLTRRLIMDLV